MGRAGGSKTSPEIFFGKEDPQRRRLVTQRAVFVRAYVPFSRPMTACMSDQTSFRVSTV